MKKTLIYFLIPALGLIIFGAAYWQFDQKYEQVEADKKAAKIKEKKDKIEEEQRSRDKAMKEALAAQEVRKKEKEAKEAKDRKDKEDRELAVQARDKAGRESVKSKERVTRLTGEIKTTEEAIAKIEEDKKRLADEEAFLKTYVKTVQSNQKSLMAVLDKIDAADKAAEAAAKAAAAAAAKK